MDSCSREVTADKKEAEDELLSHLECKEKRRSPTPEPEDEQGKQVATADTVLPSDARCQL